LVNQGNKIPQINNVKVFFYRWNDGLLFNYMMYMKAWWIFIGGTLDW